MREGSHHTEVSNQKNRESNLGKEASEETKQKMRDNHKGMEGKHHTDKSKEKMSINSIGKGGLKGKKNPMFGMIGELNPNYGNHVLRGVAKSKEHKKAIGDALRDKPKSEEAKTNMKGERPTMKGETNPNYGGGLFGKENGNWKGGRDMCARRNGEKGWIELNDKFPGAHGHHIDKELVLYLPKELHQSVPHNVFTGKGMEEINNLACEYVYGIKTEG